MMAFGMGFDTSKRSDIEKEAEDTVYNQELSSVSLGNLAAR